jgi:serine/threonine protein kinase
MDPGAAAAAAAGAGGAGAAAANANPLFAIGKPPPLGLIRAKPKVMLTPERLQKSRDLSYENPNPHAGVAIITKDFPLRFRNPAAEILKELNEFPTIDLFLVPLLKQEVIGTGIYQTFPRVGVDLATIGPDVYQANRLIIMATLNEAVAFLHSRDILHRDIKPENVVWDPVAMRAKLIDFDSLVRVNGDEIIEPNSFGGTIGHRIQGLKSTKFSKERDRFNVEVTIQALDRAYLGDEAAAALWPAGFSLNSEQFLPPPQGGKRSKSTRKHRSQKKNVGKSKRLRAGRSRRRNR